MQLDMKVTMCRIEPYRKEANYGNKDGKIKKNRMAGV
jgi:hypothetical protein